MPGNSAIGPKSKKSLESLAIDIRQIKKSLRMGTASLAPLNYIEEMDKFFKRPAYNPQYVYKQRELPNYPESLKHYKSEVEKLKIPEDLKEHLLEFLDDLENLYLTKLSIGTDNFSSNAHNLFDWGTDRLDMLLTNTPDVPFELHIKHILRKADFIKEMFEKTLKKYGLKNYKVVLNSSSPHIINVVHNQVNVGSDIKRFECNIERLVIHEIETHVLQIENTFVNFSPLSEFTKYGNQHLYGEGLAIYNEITTRKITPSAFETYYFRIKAVRNLNKSFREIFEILSEDLDANKAFVMTYRVKRGLSDTSKPGGFPKDASYLLGYHEIQNLINEGYDERLLYATQSPILSTLLNKYNLIDTNKILTPKFEE
jgi:hypothetical protein